MSAQRPPASQVILTRIDHASRTFYQCDPAPNWPQPDFPVAEAQIPFLQQVVLMLGGNMAGLAAERYRLFVGYLLAAYHNYQNVVVDRMSELGQDVVREWEDYANNN